MITVHNGACAVWQLSTSKLTPIPTRMSSQVQFEVFTDVSMPVSTVLACNHGDIVPTWWHLVGQGSPTVATTRGRSLGDNAKYIKQYLFNMGHSYRNKMRRLDSEFALGGTPCNCLPGDPMFSDHTALANLGCSTLIRLRRVWLHSL